MCGKMDSVCFDTNRFANVSYVTIKELIFMCIPHAFVS